MDLKKPLSFNGQLNHLEEHNMVLPDKLAALNLLKQANYYRLSGYSFQFRKEDDPEHYKDGTSFETIAELYAFDAQLRDVLKRYIEIAEVYYRTQIAHHFSMIKCINPPHDQHYLESNYYNKERFREILDDIERQKTYYSDSLVIKHHQKKYGGKMPLWAIVEMISFSDLSKLYSCMYYSEQDAIAVAVGTGPETLKNHLHCMAVLRNRCAHAARLYNVSWRPSAKYPERFFQKHPEFSNDTLFAYVGVLVKRLPEIQDKQDLIDDICAVIDAHANVVDLQLIGFPENYKDLLKSFVR